MEITPDHIRLFRRFLNLAENDSGSPETDYAAVYLYGDGNGGRRQVTLGRGFTDDGGNLRKVIDGYLARGGKFSDLFRARLGKFGKGVLDEDAEFLQALKSAAAEPAMQAAQDEAFNAAYLNPAMEWAETHGFREVLSAAIIIDSTLHSGSMLKWLMAGFSERKPAAGGNEHAWIFAYLKARLEWFARATGPLHSCMFRPKFFLSQIASRDQDGVWHLKEVGGNWDFRCPLIVPGKGTIC